MRQVGTLPSETQARRFAVWLVAQRIEAHAEQEQSGWVVWVRDEDQLAKAREAFAHFRESPDDAKYQGAEKTAETLAREEETRRRQAQGNVVEMRGRWGSAAMPGARRRAPVVMALIGISAVVAMLTWPDTMELDTRDEQRSEAPPGSLYRSLTFLDPLIPTDSDQPESMWKDLGKGEIWRAITPIFIHFGLMHIVFNMMMLFSFGTAVEDRRGSLFMLLLVLGLAITSNLGQAMEATLRGELSNFGGMSGVCYGLFGYVLTKSRFDSRERYHLSPGTTFIALAWLVLCILREVPGFHAMLSDALPAVANTAHVVGLLVGAAVAYAPVVLRKAA